MEYNNISLKFTLQTQTEYRNTKIQTCLQGLLPWDISLKRNTEGNVKESRL